MNRLVTIEEITMLDVHREFMGNLEKSINLVAQDIDETGKMAHSRTDAWCRATESVLDELGNLIGLMSAPRWFPKEDAKKISELRHLIRDLDTRYKASKGIAPEAASHAC